MRRAGDFETRFQKITVWKSPLATEFRVAGAIHASFHRKRFLTGLAWDLIAAAALLRPSGKPASILMLGVAGGTALRTLRHLLPEASLTGIDLDGELIHLARKEMAIGETGAEIVIDDAYAWMKNNDRKFDVIIDDLYLAGDDDVFRADECDGGWLDLTKRSLAPGGILAINLVTGSGHRAKQSTTRKRVCCRFPVVRSLRTEESMNEILVAGDRVATGSVLRDHLGAFTDWRDRMFWSRIKVRKLK
jgi:predicted membrane-bound spermidine synthase